MSSDLAALRELFRSPTNRYRHLAILHHLSAGRRHSWDKNTRAETEQPVDTRAYMSRRLSRLVDMGFGGLVTNVGPSSYLENEEEWLVFLTGFQVAREMDLRFWIYDEDGYPSGAAGGVVLRDHPEYEAQAITRMQVEAGPGEVEVRPPSGWLNCVRAEMTAEGSGDPVDITSAVGTDGVVRIISASRCTVTRFDARRAFEGTHCTANVHSIRRYINVLSPDAVGHFFRVTAEEYIRRLGPDAGVVEAVFTDEPSLMAAYFPDPPESLRGKVPIKDAPAEQWDRLPMIGWDGRLPELFLDRWGYDLLPEIGRLFAGSSPRDLRVRHDFYQLQSEVYARVFFAFQQERLKEQGIEFSGHVLAEEPTEHHVASEGNVLADLRQMGIPGIDILSSIPEEMLDTPRLLTCKYGSSAAHLAGREQVMCEASQWEQDCIGVQVGARQRQAAVAMQMALGVTTITSYYGWKDFEHDEIRSILDHWARLATIVRHGTHIADIAVLYPIRTAWACYKPVDQVLSASLMDEPLKSMTGHLMTIARSIIARGLDFDFIDTSDLVGAGFEGGKLRAGNESYSMLVLPPGAVMCPNDLELLERFVAAGGRVLAFEPCCEWSIQDGESHVDAIARLEREAPDRAKRFAVDADWTGLLDSAASADANITLNGSHLVARRSVYESTDFVLLVNGSDAPASAEVAFGPGRKIELWDPADGSSRAVQSDTASVDLEGYSALVVVSERSGS